MNKLDHFKADHKNDVKAGEENIRIQLCLQVCTAEKGAKVRTKEQTISVASVAV